MLHIHTWSMQVTRRLEGFNEVNSITLERNCFVFTSIYHVQASEPIKILAEKSDIKLLLQLYKWFQITFRFIKNSLRIWIENTLLSLSRSIHQQDSETTQIQLKRLKTL